MSGYAQHNGYFSLDNAAGSPTDYSSEVIEASLNIKPMTGEHHTLNSRGGQQTVGGYSGDLSLKIKLGITATALVSVLNTWMLSSTLPVYSTSKSFILSVPDNATAGSHRYSGEVIGVDMGAVAMASGGKGDVQSQDVKFKTDGTITYAVI